MVRQQTAGIVRSASRLTRSRARTFYLASLFLPRRVRREVHVIYAYYRAVDDLVDEPQPGLSIDAIKRRLSDWEDELCGRRPLSWELLGEIQRLAEKHSIPADYLTMVLRGARFDLDLQSIETLQELLDYSVLVAGSVGMVMACVLGARSEPALSAACDLGVAMQLTNVLRDVREDYARGRVYLPSAEMSIAGCGAEVLARGVVTPEFCAVLQCLIEEARRRYQSGADGVRYLDSSVQFSIFLAANLYARILDKIEREQFDVFARRVRLGAIEKWALTMPLLLQHRSVYRR